MADISVAPVRPVNVITVLLQGLRQVEALKQAQQQRAFLSAQQNYLAPVASTPNGLNAFNDHQATARPGSTQIDPYTGEAISVGTTPMVTSDQSAIAALQRVRPQLTDVLQQLPAFQSGWKNTMTNLQGLSNRWLGSHFSAPSERAQGQASLESAPESLLKAYGLRPSEYALAVMKKTIAPHSGESSQGYRQRVVNKLKELSEYEQQSAQRLQAGIDLSALTRTPVNTPSDAILAEIQRRQQAGKWP